MINRKFVAMVLAVGLLLSMGCVVGLDKFAEEPGAKELAYKDQTGLVIPGPEDVIVTPANQAQPEAVMPTISLWIEVGTSRTQYAHIPIESSVLLSVYIPPPNEYAPSGIPIPGELLKMYPSTLFQPGNYQKYYYNFNPEFDQISFRGDVAGTYYLLVTTNDPSSNSVLQWSNAVIIEVE
jgi:hypothetical protein